jgi:oligopeptide/dipeptide ABC transporter ATP-binding protein
MPSSLPVSALEIPALLEVDDLQTHITESGQVTRAVDGISFQLEKGRTLAIVGESGSGKTMTALSIVRLLPTATAQIVGGRILFEGRDLTVASEGELRQIRGDRIAIMFQDPLTALNPSLRVGPQVMEPLLEHRRVDRAEARQRAVEMLARTHLPDPAAVFDAYPHQLSGGMRQRVVLAMALACEPDVLIADEPTTALDVTTQEQIIDLLLEIQQATRLSLIVITHDLGVVARIADDVLVVYAGKGVEYGAVRDVFKLPAHPYTRGLLESIDYQQYRPRERLDSIPGVPPRLDELPPGCAFHPRCRFAIDRCREETPLLLPPPGYRTLAACHVAQAGSLPLWRKRERERPGA